MPWSIVATGLAIAAAIATLVVGFLVWKGERTNYLRVPFLWLSLAVSAWILSNVLFTVAPEEWLFPVALVSYGAATLVATQTLYFAFRLVKSVHTELRRTLVSVGYIAAVLSMIPGAVAVGVEDLTIITLPAGITIYGVIIAGYLLLACLVLAVHLRGASKALRRQIRLVLVGVAISSILGVWFNLVLPIIGNYQFILLGPASAVVFVSAIAYAIARYSLFDVRLAIVRGIAYLATFATLVGLYLLAFSLLLSGVGGTDQEASHVTLNIVLALGMALLLQPIKKFFDRVTSHVFYRDGYDVDVFFSDINRSLGASTDLRVILERTGEVVSRHIKAEQVSFFVATDERHYVFAGTEHHAHIALKDLREMQRHLDHHRDDRHVVRAAEYATDTALRRMMDAYRLDMLAPIQRDSTVIGVMCIGERRSGGYTQRDTRLLRTMVDELNIAVQKALAVEAVKYLNANLEQRIESATRELRASNRQLQRLDEVKDEFMSMASHQLRTPLTSIKGYISMLLEGDVGKVTKEQAHVLREAFMSSERMVRLIGDFLNVSRLQTGKFVIDAHPVDLAVLVRHELDALEPSAQARGLKFQYKVPKTLPILNLDENKIQQVIMNFSDNALYYSKDNSDIRVALKKSGGFIEFTVKDKGIGVPKAQQSELFQKFFRASNARQQRPDGTGVGLFLAKKVIDAHHGEIIFSSVEGKGSTFGFRLPIERLRVRDTH